MLLKAKMKASVLALIFVLALSSELHAAWYDNIYVWIGLSVGAAIALISLAYMAAKLFELPPLEAWVKIELQEVAKSVVIAVFCVALIATADSASQFLTGSPTVSQAAVNFLKQDVFADGRGIYLKLTEVYFNLARIAGYAYTYGLNVMIASVSYSSSPGSGLSPLVGQAGQAMDTVASFMMLAAAQAAFVKFFASASVVLLPLGIFLRSFSLTRKIGGIVLAGAIASAVIYPSAIMVSREVYLTFQPDLQAGIEKISVKAPPNPPTITMICSPEMYTFTVSPIEFIGGELGWFGIFCFTIGQIPGMQWFCSQQFKLIIEIIFYTIESAFPVILYQFLSIYETNAGIGSFAGVKEGYFNPVENFVLPSVSKYSVLSLVVFLIPVIITITLMRNITTVFGGEPHLYGLSKLI
ncbi:MAG: hypothetical protein QW275_02230 [Candidatus Anstonellaceae archaeon]